MFFLTRIKVIRSIANLRIVSTIICRTDVGLGGRGVLTCPLSSILPKHLQMWSLAMIFFGAISTLLLMVDAQTSDHADGRLTISNTFKDIYRKQSTYIDISVSVSLSKHKCILVRMLAVKIQPAGTNTTSN